jgi:alkanesulfonate monooxygenase SsuD/methylene tetrahydromethanopterin reductase-like flavin-dependent oxidoreductase (luciferase family)
MRFSVWPSLGQPWADVLEVSGHAEATGWDGIYAADHFMGDGTSFGDVHAPTLEATAALGALSTATERVRLGSLVFGMTYRHPAVLAKWAATIDHVSAGRLVLGVGAGWQVNEHEQYGIPLGGPGERIARLEEGLQVLRGLLTAPTTTVDGQHYRLRDAIAEPKPVGPRLPILVGGKGDRMLGVVARHADEWNMWSTPALLAERAAVLDRRCEAIGRDPATIARSTQALVFVVDDEATAADLVARVAPRPAVAGTAAHIAEVAEGWVEVGAGELIVPDFTLGTGNRRLDALDALLAAFAPLR